LFTVSPSQRAAGKSFAIIAALPEPAYGPTHGLLSRRSTDRISTSPLANFAQLSMFRFDGWITHIVFYWSTRIVLMMTTKRVVADLK
jgi:hypothetical protein